MPAFIPSGPTYAHVACLGRTARPKRSIVSRRVVALLVIAFAALAWHGVRPVDALAGYIDNVEVLAHVNEFQGYNDIWGYTSPAGDQLAIIGTHTGTAFYLTNDPTAPELVAFIPGPRSLWRDMKTHGQTCYVVTEGQGAPLQIIDLSDPRDPRLVRTMGRFRTAHNIFVDEPNARAYVCGTDIGMVIYDLGEEQVPVELGAYRNRYAHDVYVRDHIAYVASISEGRLVIVDLSNPIRPREISSLRYPGARTHNTWLSDDGSILVTTDEASSGHLKVWDVTDLERPELVSRYVAQGSAHNAILRDRICFMSYYGSGFRAISLLDPERPLEVGAFDPFGGEEVQDDVWGVYPFHSDGNTIYVSGMATGLYVLRFDDPTSKVQLAHTPLPDTPDPFRPHVVEVSVSAIGSRVEEESVQLVYQAGFGSDTTVRMERSLGDSRYFAVIPEQAEGSVVRYHVEARSHDGELGTIPLGAPARKFAFVIGAPIVRYTFDMESDDGWTVAPGTATTGVWERVEPVAGGRYFGAEWRNIVPGENHSDAGTMAWVTENEIDGDPIGIHDVDDGFTALVGPELDLAGETFARLSYWIWYETSSNETTGDDTFTVEVSSDGGEKWVEADGVVESTGFRWRRRAIDISSHVELTDTVRARFVARDGGGPTLIEALIDDVTIEVGPVLTPRFSHTSSPIVGGTTVRFDLIEPGPVTLRVFNVQGRVLRTLVDDVRAAGGHQVSWDGRTHAGGRAPSGIYFLRLETGTTTRTQKLLIHR